MLDRDTLEAAKESLLESIESVPEVVRLRRLVAKIDIELAKLPGKSEPQAPPNEPEAPPAPTPERVSDPPARKRGRPKAAGKPKFSRASLENIGKAQSERWAETRALAKEYDISMAEAGILRMKQKKNQAKKKRGKK
jgi:hypothetical protein